MLTIAGGLILGLLGLILFGFLLAFLSWIATRIAGAFALNRDRRLARKAAAEWAARKAADEWTARRAEAAKWAAVGVSPKP
jgi:hypothetical protein